MNAAHSSARLTGNRTSTFSRFYFSDFVYRDLTRFCKVAHLRPCIHVSGNRVRNGVSC